MTDHHIPVPVDLINTLDDAIGRYESGTDHDIPAVRAIYDACATILGTTDVPAAIVDARGDRWTAVLDEPTLAAIDAAYDEQELWRLRAAVIDAYFTDHPDVSIAAVDALRDALGNWDGAR